MRWKDFIPALDGRSYEAMELPTILGEQVVEETLHQAYTDTLAYLDRHYVGAVKRFQLDQLLSVWNAPAVLKTDLLHVCKLCVLLDHFHARLPLIRSIRTGSRSTKGQDYLKDRMHKSGGDYAAARFKTIAIFGLMPESWIGEEKLKQAISREIGGAGAVERPLVTFDLKIAKSGVAWMTDTVLSDIEQLTAHLDDHRPQIVTYVLETKDYKYLTMSAIAYHYQVLKKDTIEIDIYHPDDHRMVRIRVDPARSRYYADSERISGLYLENYQVEAVPVGGWERLLKSLLLMEASWYLRRFFHHCFGWFRRK